jgi:hypothetical protein
MLASGVLQAEAMTTAAAQQPGRQGDKLSVEDALVLMQQAVRKGQLQEVRMHYCPLVQQPDTLVCVVGLLLVAVSFGMHQECKHMTSLHHN